MRLIDGDLLMLHVIAAEAQSFTRTDIAKLVDDMPIYHIWHNTQSDPPEQSGYYMTHNQVLGEMILEFVPEPNNKHTTYGGVWLNSEWNKRCDAVMTPNLWRGLTPEELREFAGSKARKEG